MTNENLPADQTCKHFERVLDGVTQVAVANPWACPWCRIAELERRYECALQALNFWLPNVPESPGERADRIGRDAMLLIDLHEDNCEDTAYTRGWVRLSNEPGARLTDHDRQQIKELLDAASQPPVEHGFVGPLTVEEHLQHLRSSLSWEGASDTIHGVYLEDGETVVCHTGNGPHSEANARLITFAINNLRKLVECIPNETGDVQARLAKDRILYGTSYQRVDVDGTVTRLDPSTVMIAPQPEEQPQPPGDCPCEHKDATGKWIRCGRPAQLNGLCDRCTNEIESAVVKGELPIFEKNQKIVANGKRYYCPACKAEVDTPIEVLGEHPHRCESTNTGADQPPENRHTLTFDVNTPVMSLEAKSGDRVVYMGINGWPGDTEHCERHGLVKGVSYVVSFVDVGQSSSSVYLRGQPGVRFNTVCFCDQQPKNTGEQQ